MPRKIGTRTSLDTLRKDARRWLKALRRGDAAARVRLDAAWPHAPRTPGLRDLQHALALEYGTQGWIALKEAVAARAIDRLPDAEKVAVILHHPWQGDLAAAARIIRQSPHLARHSLAMAVLCGDLEAVQQFLAADPATATAPAGALGWQPLLYLAYGRLPLPQAADNAAAIATALIEAGGDPNASFNDGWDNAFTVLTGVIGAGEDGWPPHPLAPGLAALLVRLGADPFDTQALYNTSLRHDEVFWLNFLFIRSAGRGDTHLWTQLQDPSRIGGKYPMPVIDYLLGNAVGFNHPARVAWLLEHGADPSGVNAYSGRPHHEVAELSGASGIAALLRDHGAQPAPLIGQAAFQAAAMRLDRATAVQLAQEEPAILADPEPLIQAAGANKVEVVALLLDLGMAVDVAREDGMRPLHAAAQHGALDTARQLIEAGADIDRRGSRHDATPLGFAVHGRDRAMIDLLAPLSRDLFGLAHAGRIERLSELLTAQPSLANDPYPDDGATPLFALPNDEGQAMAVAELLLAHGADPAHAAKSGETPAQAARRRGLDDVADLIEARLG